MKTLKLDTTKWRCGGNTPVEGCGLGEGTTSLCNDEGFMCCLGQFSLQLNNELTVQHIMDIGEPADVGCPIDDLNDEGINTELASKAIDINDDRKTTIEDKIAKLRELFYEYDYEIEVI